MEENVLKKMAEQPPLTADLLVRKIYARLEENIMGMNLPPGSKLIEDDIAQVLGVSRSPVREALLQLENAGLVVRQAGKGRVVASFTEQEIMDHYEVWAMVESFAGGLACLTATAEDFLRIEAILDRMREDAGGETLDAYRELNYSFHRSMVLPCPNRTIFQMFENVLKPIQWCWNLSILWQNDRSLSYSEHKELWDLYRKRDRVQYERLVRRHIGEAAERFRREYAKRNGPKGTAP